jgi:uncharacterized protein (TIGR04255 family)
MTDFPQPTFDLPPVIETVYSAQFEPLPAFRNAHLGAFWQTLGDEWPEVADAALLPAQNEYFGQEQIWERLGSLRLAIHQNAAARIQIRNAKKNRMVQVQNGCLIYNWLQLPGERYPRDRAIRPEFDQMLRRFTDFVSAQKLGEVKFNQWEVTYVNHLPINTVWQTPKDWPSLFNGLAQPAAEIEGLSLESLGGTWRYVIPPNRGRLHVGLQHGRTAEGPAGVEALIVTLTARGPVSDADGGLAAGISLGHNAIVGTFARMMSDKARGQWGEEEK